VAIDNALLDLYLVIALVSAGCNPSFGTAGVMKAGMSLLGNANLRTMPIPSA